MQRSEDTPQVKQLISIINDEMSKEELMFALSLKDARNFRQRYLLPAISNNLIEMTDYFFHRDFCISRND
jgi:D-ribose pyranose/furanose isomerase RbsD